MTEVSVEVDGGIATIRLARPPMNALNVAVQEGLRAAARQVSADDAVRAAGADIK
jgi:enoyl-CoA hydratase/carnithine racemase